MVSKLSEIWSGFFIPDPDPDFLPILYPGSRGQKGTGSRSRKTAGNEEMSVGSGEATDAGPLPLGSGGEEAGPGGGRYRHLR